MNVEVFGIDSGPVHRDGNISGSGVFLEWNAEAPPSGSVERLNFYRAGESTVVASALAVLVRTVASKDLWAGDRTEGLAFEFFLESDAHVRELDRYVEEVTAGATSLDPLHPPVSAPVRPPELVLRSHHPLERHTPVTLSVITPDGDLQLQGEVQRTQRVNRLNEAPRFESVIGVAGLLDAVGTDIDAAMAGLLTKMVTPKRPEASLFSHDTVLEGELSRVRLPALLNLLSSEVFTGVVEVTSKKLAGRVFLSKGDPIDAELDTGVADSSRDAFRQLFALAHGHFRFSVGPVDRTRTLGGSGAFLLLDIAREIDEGAGHA